MLALAITQSILMKNFDNIIKNVVSFCLKKKIKTCNILISQKNKNHKQNDVMNNNLIILTKL